MSYVLKQYDTSLIEFDITRTVDDIKVEIIWVNDEKKYLIPLDMQVDENGIKKWLEKRTIPSNRAYVQNFLAKVGLNEKDTKGIIDYCMGLSLNDSYWVVPKDFEGTYGQYNLYDNKFNAVLSQLAFTGYGSFIKSSFRSSPEFTTGGMLAKCWRRKNDKILLYKSGTEGFANSGKEPYSEFYAYQVAEKMGLKAVKYGLSKWKNKLCCTCELFTSKDVSYIPAGKIIREGGIKAVMDFYKNLGEEYYQELVSMLTFDAIILNEDRHFGNFGFLIDNKENKIIGTAPIFDNGMSLLFSAMESDLVEAEKFAATRMPRTYNSFLEFTKEIMGPQQHKQLRNLINFKFKKNTKYNLDDERIKILENLIQLRVRELLE